MTDPAEERSVAGKRVMVVFYSESGHTRLIADELAAALGASVERIGAPDLPGGGWGFFWRTWQSILGGSARIAEPSLNPEDYDVVLVGSPVWAGRIASPVRAYLRRFAGKVKTAAGFVSCSKTGAESALAELDKLVAGRAVAHLSVCDEDRVNGRDVGKILDFVKTVEEAAGLPSIPAADESSSAASRVGINQERMRPSR